MTMAQRSENLAQAMFKQIGPQPVGVDMSSDLFRLRIGSRIVGYRKQVGSYVFYSRDDFWYNGAEFDFEHEEPFTGLKDRRGRKLFVGDVVRCEAEGKELTLRIANMDNDGPHCCCHVTLRPIHSTDVRALLAGSQFIGLC
jgi:hypothetical protein